MRDYGKRTITMEYYLDTIGSLSLKAEREAKRLYTPKTAVPRNASIAEDDEDSADSLSETRAWTESSENSEDDDPEAPANVREVPAKFLKTKNKRKRAAAAAAAATAKSSQTKKTRPVCPMPNCNKGKFYFVIHFCSDFSFTLFSRIPVQQAIRVRTTSSEVWSL